MTMTGARLKEILEDVADNLFNPDPYYQQGGDMVRCGGLGYTIDIGKPMGSRISALTHLKSGAADRARARIRRRRLGERERGHRGPAGVGAGREIRGGEEDRAGRAEYVGEGRRRLKSFALAANLRKNLSRSQAIVEECTRAVVWLAPWTTTPDKRPTRRGLLTGGRRRAGDRPALAGNPKNLPPNVPDWTRALGDGVAVRPYGQPSKHEAHVIRRDVQWLTASRESSVSFTPLHELDGIITPSGLCFERHHGGIAEIDPGRLPADRARPGRQGR